MTLFALGLSQVLGRADHVEQFLKKGTKLGYTEIELKSPNGRNGEPGRNVVVKREIVASSNKTKFWLNGERPEMRIEGRPDQAVG
jgi:hypothetical protein